MAENLKVAVIGPFFNGMGHVRSWLRGFVHQTYSNYRIYLVDDASTDETVTLVRHYAAKWALPLTLIENEENLGPAAARNRAIEKALSDGADLILLLDSDCRIRAHWIANHVRFHIGNPYFPVVGGGIVGCAKSKIGIADGFCSWFTAVPFSKSGVVRKLHLSSTNMSIRSHVFRSVGLFDVSLKTGEDVAFCRKVRQAGLSLFFLSDLVVEHLDREDWAPALRHHYRWGLHSSTLSRQTQGGYYSVLDKLGQPWIVRSLVPLIAALNVVLVVTRFFPSHPRVLFYLPWIARLKWENAKGVYRGFVEPQLCLTGIPAEKLSAKLEASVR